LKTELERTEVRGFDISAKRAAAKVGTTKTT
jgi:hypothetical protein